MFNPSTQEKNDLSETSGRSSGDKRNRFPFIRLSAVVIACVMFLTYYGNRMGLTESINFLPLILSVTLILLPDALRTFCRLNRGLSQMAVLILFFVLGWISILIKTDLSILLYIAFIGSIYFHFKFNGSEFKKVKWMTGALIMLLALELVSSVWTPDYMNPLAPEAYAVGMRYVHVDTLFLSTLTSNLKNFHFPTLGLFGLEPLKYHAGSNYLFASLSTLCRTDVLEFYNFAFPIIFVPQFFVGFFFAAVSGVRTDINDKRATLALVVFFFVLTGLVSQRLGSDYMLPSSLNSHFVSQSYCVSLIFAFLFVAAYYPLINRSPVHPNIYINVLLILLIPCWFFVMGYTKVSTGIVIFTGFAYVVFRKKLILDKWLFVATTASTLMLYWVLEITVEQNENTFIIQPGSFFRMFVDGNVFMYLFLNYFWVLFGLLLVFFVNRNSNRPSYLDWLSGKFIIGETIIVMAVIGALPGILIHIPGGSALYFSDIQYWFSAAWVVHLSFCIKFASMSKKLQKYTMIGALIIAAIMVRESVFRSYYYLWKKNIRIRAALLYGKDNKSLQEAKLIDLLPIANSLFMHIKDASLYQSQTKLLNLPLFEEVRNLPDSIRSTSLIFWEDPQSVEAIFACSEATFFVPAMSELPMINGLFWKECWLAGGYGMRSYFEFPEQISRDQAFHMARQGGFRHVISLNLADQKYVIEKL